MNSSPSSPFLRMSRTLTFWSAALMILLLAGFLRGFVPPEFGSLVWGTLSSIALMVLIRFFLRTDGRTLPDAGLGWEPTSSLRFGSGLVLGVTSYIVTLLLISAVLGPVRVIAGETPAAGMLLLTVAGLVALAIMEELAFRSYALWNTHEALGLWPAQVVVAVAFGLMHLAYGWPVATVALGVMPSALLFGMAAFISRGLALPLGIHLGMNLARWASGEADGHGVWRLDTTGLDAASAPLWAPALGALVPLAIAAALYLAWRRNDLPAALRSPAQ